MPMDKAEQVALEIERKLCSFCCDRLYDKPKPEPCADCTDPGVFEAGERAAVIEILRSAFSSNARKEPHGQS
jgi:hypothetical protein